MKPKARKKTLKQVSRQVQVPVQIELVPHEHEGDRWWGLYIDDEDFDGVALPIDVDPEKLIALVVKHGPANFMAYLPDEWRAEF